MNPLREDDLSDLEKELQVEGTTEKDARSLLGKIANFYFTPKQIEKWRNGKIYEWLGVHKYKKYLPTMGDIVSRKLGWHPIIGAKNREEGLKNYEISTRQYEKIHLASSIVVTPIIVLTFTIENYIGGGISLGFNLVVNYYPILVQRYNRARIYNTLEKMNK